MSDFGIYIAVIVAIVTAIVIYVRRRFTYWSRNGVPGPNFIDFSAFTREQHIHLTEQTAKYGPIYGGYTLAGKYIVINEPDLVNDVMVKDFHVFTDRQDINIGTTLMKYNIFFLPGDDRWKRIRSIITPTFTSGKLKSMAPHMHNITDNLVKHIAKVANTNDAINLRTFIGAFAMDVISACAYGVNADSIQNAEHPIVVNAKRMLNFDANVSLVLSVLAPSIARFLRLNPFNANGVKYFDELTNQIVGERKKLLQNGSTDSGMKKISDFIEIMMEKESDDNVSENSNSNDISKNDNKTLTSDELTAQGIAFFIAGFDTTGSALTHCFHYLSRNQECQQKLYEELQNTPDFEHETLNQLTYLNAVIHETLRLCPSLLVIDRTCSKDYRLGTTGITLPAKTTVIIHPYVIHRDPRYFSDPDQFKPERFINPTHNPRAYITFGGGPRNCVGMRFALNEMRVCVAKLVTSFKFEPKPDFKLSYFTGNILFSPKDLLVHIKTRK